MAHYFESGFFVRSRAWHGLGTVVQDAPTTADALRLAELDWPVETVPAFADIDGEHIPAPDARHVIRRRNGFAPDILGTVGSRFEPLQNRDAFRWFDPLIGDGDMTLEAAGSVRDGRNVWILARVANVDDVQVGRNAADIVSPYLLLSNAHDGSRAVTVTFTPIRVVCWNTLSAAHSRADSKGSGAVRIRHTASLTANLAALRDRIDIEARNFESKALVWNELAAADVTSSAAAERYVRTVFGKPDENGDLPPVRAERHVAELFLDGPGADSAGRTWFGLYMAATHYIDHLRGRNESSRLASSWFGDGAELRAKAERVAVELAGV